MVSSISSPIQSGLIFFFATRGVGVIIVSNLVRRVLLLLGASTIYTVIMNKNEPRFRRPTMTLVNLENRDYYHKLCRPPRQGFYSATFLARDCGRRLQKLYHHLFNVLPQCCTEETCFTNCCLIVNRRCCGCCCDCSTNLACVLSRSRRQKTTSSNKQPRHKKHIQPEAAIGLFKATN